jgi:two-component system CheB/CheR fusion protein
MNDPENLHRIFEEGIIKALEISGLGIIDWNFSTDEIIFSEQAQKLLEISEEKSDKNKFFQKVYSKDLDKVQSDIQKIEDTSKDVFETSFRLAPKGEKYLQIKGSISKNENQEVHLTAIISDNTISVIKENEFEQQIRDRQSDLIQAKNEIQRSISELEQFAYIASHDLQEPLRKIMTFTERFQRKYLQNIEEEGRIFLDKVVDASSRMSKLIDELLRFSRITRQTKDYIKTDLNVVVNEVLTELKTIIEQKNAKIKVEQLPVLLVAPQQISQLFFNLLSNALKFTHSGAVPEINIKSETISGKELPENSALRRNRNYCKISISDNGLGFNQKYAEKIFVIFQRLHDKNLFPGNGIGLAISRKIVNNHEGEITAESVENEGTTFKILLPQ